MSALDIGSHIRSHQQETGGLEESETGVGSPWSPLQSVGLLLLKATGPPGAPSLRFCNCCCPCLSRPEGCPGSPLLLALGLASQNSVTISLFSCPQRAPFEGTVSPCQAPTDMKMFSSSASFSL